MEDGRSVIKFDSRTKKLVHPSLWWCACFFVYFLVSVTACGPKRSDLLDGGTDTLAFTTMTENVYTLISDSGITKYKLQTKVWYTFDAPESKWYFPEGLYVEQFDTLFNIEASIQADTAYYYQDKNLWELKGNVKLLNREGQRFFAKTLFWDEKDEDVYSHDSVRIERPGGEFLTSKYGFKSNQSMTRYELYSSSGHLDVEDKPVARVDSVATDEWEKKNPPQKQNVPDTVVKDVAVKGRVINHTEK